MSSPRGVHSTCMASLSQDQPRHRIWTFELDIGELQAKRIFEQVVEEIIVAIVVSKHLDAVTWYHMRYMRVVERARENEPHVSLEGL